MHLTASDWLASNRDKESYQNQWSFRKDTYGLQSHAVCGNLLKFTVTSYIERMTWA